MNLNDKNSSKLQYTGYRRRYHYCILVLITTALTLVIFQLIYDHTRYKYIKVYAISDDSDNMVSSKSVNSSQIKTIKVWTQFFSGYFIPDNLTELHCPSSVGMCVINRNRKGDQKEADAIILHVRNVNPHDLPPERNESSKQVWVLYNYESPAHVSRSIYAQLNQKIDITVSYRIDSDIFAPYGRLKPRNLPLNEELLNETVFNKKLPAVSLVSDCHTGGNRETFIEQLKTSFPVDVFGICGKPAVFCSSDARGCYQELSKRYKFFFSFENTMCVDYITEKFYLALDVGMVPVVLGGADYSMFAPAGSYINALDFETPKLLGEYLTTVAHNFTLYRQYFEWKKNYTLDFSNFDNSTSKRWICDLCNYLHQEKNQKPESWRSKHRRNLINWWFNKNVCWKWLPTRNNVIKYVSKKLKEVFTSPLKVMYYH